MKTLLNNEVAPDTLGIVYLCDYSMSIPKIEVIKELQFKTQFEALEAYANIPNAESQLITGIDREDLFIEMEKLHKNMKDKKWLEELAILL